jgi:hypothetical protein
MNTETSMTLVGLSLLGFAVLIAVLAFVFWVWMLIDCARNRGLDGTEKAVWILLIVFTHSLGGLIYFFVARPKGRIA